MVKIKTPSDHYGLHTVIDFKWFTSDYAYI